MNDGEKIAALMRALRGSIKDNMYSILREQAPGTLTIQKFQDIFVKQTAKSAKELENRMRKVSLQNTTSFYDLYKTIKNIVEEQLTAAGVKK